MSSPQTPGCHTQRPDRDGTGGPVLPSLPSAEDLDVVVAEREKAAFPRTTWKDVEEIAELSRMYHYDPREDRKFSRKRFLREAGFWLLVAAALGMAAWTILQGR